MGMTLYGRFVVHLPSPATQSFCWVNLRRTVASAMTASRRPCMWTPIRRRGAGRSRPIGLIQRRDLKLLCHACAGGVRGPWRVGGSGRVSGPCGGAVELSAHSKVTG